MNVEIEIPVVQLKSVLPGLGKVVPRSSGVPVLQCIKVSLSRDAKIIEIEAHDLDQIAMVRLENQTYGIPGQVLVPLDMLSKIVKGCAPNQSIRLISTKDETKIRYIVAGSVVERLATRVSPKEWPEVKTIDAEPILLENDFKVALKEAFECACEDSSRYILNGACLDITDRAAHYVIGTDGRHLYSANTFQFNLPESLIVPSCKFLCWPGFIDDGPWKVSMLPGVKSDPKAKGKDKEEPPWFKIDSDHWSFVARGIDGEFPNWKQVVPQVTDRWTQIVLQPSAAKALIEALPQLPGGDDLYRSVTLVSGKRLVLRAKDRNETKWTSIDIPDATITGKAVETTLDRTYLLQALRFGLHQIALKDPLEPLVFTGAGKTMVVMPIRLESAATAAPGKEEKLSPNENASAATPSPAEVNNQTEQRKDMSTTTMTAPERGNMHANNGTNGQKEDIRSAYNAMLEQIDKIKTTLKDVIADLSDATTMLKTAEKEQRASAKEVQVVRAKLRELQNVEI